MANEGLSGAPLLVVTKQYFGYNNDEVADVFRTNTFRWLIQNQPNTDYHCIIKFGGLPDVHVYSDNNVFEYDLRQLFITQMLQYRPYMNDVDNYQMAVFKDLFFKLVKNLKVVLSTDTDTALFDRDITITTRAADWKLYIDPHRVVYPFAAKGVLSMWVDLPMDFVFYGAFDKLTMKVNGQVTKVLNIDNTAGNFNRLNVSGINNIFYINKSDFANEDEIKEGAILFSIQDSNEDISVGEIEINLKCKPAGEGLYLKWLSNEGYWKYWLFEGKQELGIEVKDGGYWIRQNDDDFNSRLVSNFKNAEKVYQVYSHNLTKNELRFLSDLALSPAVYLYQGANNFKSVHIEQKNVTLVTRNGNLGSIKFNIIEEQNTMKW